MIPSIYDPCLHNNQNLLSNENPELAKEIVCLQADDTAYHGKEVFLGLEDKAKINV